MKRILVLLALTCHFAGAQATDQTARAADLVRTTRNAIPEKYRNPASIVEMRSTLKKIGAFVTLQTEFPTSWEETLGAIGTVAPDSPSIAIYFKAAEVLPKREYAGFMLAAADGVSSGEISIQQFKWGLFPAEKHLRDMWNENEKPPAMIDLARKAKTLLANEPESVRFFDDVLAGKGTDGTDSPNLSSSSDCGSGSQPGAMQIPRSVKGETHCHTGITALIISGLALVIGFVILRIHPWRKNS